MLKEAEPDVLLTAAARRRPRHAQLRQVAHAVLNAFNLANPRLRLLRDRGKVLFQVDTAGGRSILVLNRAGHVRLIGSVVTALMVWRDIDVQVVAPGLQARRAWAVIAPLAAHPRVDGVRYCNQAGPRSFAGDARTSRFYVQVSYRTRAGGVWKLDVSFWRAADRREEAVTYQAALVRQLDPEARLAILWIKSLWVERPERRDVAYGREVASIDIYDAVLEHAVRTPEAFDAYLTARGKPTRSLHTPGAD